MHVFKNGGGAGRLVLRGDGVDHVLHGGEIPPGEKSRHDDAQQKEARCEHKHARAVFLQAAEGVGCRLDAGHGARAARGYGNQAVCAVACAQMVYAAGHVLQLELEIRDGGIAPAARCALGCHHFAAAQEQAQGIRVGHPFAEALAHRGGIQGEKDHARGRHAGIGGDALRNDPSGIGFVHIADFHLWQERPRIKGRSETFLEIRIRSIKQPEIIVV